MPPIHAPIRRITGRRRALFGTVAKRMVWLAFLLALAVGVKAQAQIATTVTLTLSNNSPTYTTPMAPGVSATLNPVVVTATVTETVSGKAVTGGTVTFYDNPGIPGAAGPDVIGSASIQFPVGGSGGTAGIATLPFAFGPGQHSLTASYSGTATGSSAVYVYASSTTANAVSLNSNGFAAEVYGFQLLGNAGTIAYFNPQSSLSQLNYNLNQDPVYSYPFLYGYGMQVPTGTTTVTDQTTGTVYPMAGNDYPDLYENLYAPQLTAYNAFGDVYGDYLYSLPQSGVGYFFVADVFQSGVPALITLSATQNQIWTYNLYSNPTGIQGCNGGTSTGGNSTCAVTTPPVQGLAADVNGDGALDLVIAHNDPTGTGSVGVLLNHLVSGGCFFSQCTFLTESTYATGHPAAWVQVGDVNGDGYPDIVAVSSDGSNLISVLLNNGDGTFTTSAQTFQAGNGARQFYLADLNQDGVLDIAVLNQTDATIGILFGDGDGTFQPMLPYGVGTNPTSFAMADLNLDGYPDFAITNSDSATQAEVSFLYGTGSGTFSYMSDLSQNQLYLNTGYPETNPMPTVITATDVNGDGYPDLFIGYNINQYTYALWSPVFGHYVYSQTGYTDVPNGLNLRTSSLPVADLDGDGLKDQLYMPLINNNISCSSCSPTDNNLMVRTNGAFVYGWSGPSQIDSPLGNHTFTAQYTPPANSIYRATAAGPITINIFAEPIITVTPTSVNFGLEQVGTTSAPANVTLQNTGNAAQTNLAFSIINVNIAGAGFAVSPGSCGSTLAAGAACTATITFSPGSSAAFIGNLLVSGTGLQAEVALQGVGTDYPVGNINVSETIKLTDTLSSTTVHAVSVNETIKLTDTVSGAMTQLVSVSETVHLTDILSTSAATRVSVAEMVHLTDTVNATTLVMISDAETIHVADTTTTQLSALIVDNEAIHVTDSTTTLVTSYTDTTQLTVSATSVSISGSVGLTATVKPGGTSTAPTGLVNFYDGGNLVGSTALAAGSASFTETGLSAGVHSLYAMYAGSSTFPSSTSATIQVAATSTNILTVTPVSTSRNFDTANPAFTYSISGFVNGDTVAVVSGAPVLSTTAGLNSPAGSYPITGLVGTLSAPSKYAFNVAAGTLTVNGGATQTITFNPLPNVPFSAVTQETLTAHSTSASLGQPIVYVVTGPATISGNTLTINGIGMVTVTATQAANATFNAAVPVARTFTVMP